MPFGVAKVLCRHDVAYFRCESCGFIFTEKPHWLNEAYSSAITQIDIGPVSRCVTFSHFVRSLVFGALDRTGQFLDFGGGYGLFVRRMRDLGVNFKLYDAHCENIFAKGHEVDIASPSNFELLTAFEVVEHLENPLETFETFKRLSKNILFSTCIVPEPAPTIGNWWYYAPEHGQHICFYTRRSLQVIATRLGLNLYSHDDTHYMTANRMSPSLFAMMTDKRSAPAMGYLLSQLKGVRSLLPSDYQALSGQSFN